jgi:hypothetical protein
MSAHPNFIYSLTIKLAYFKQLHPDLEPFQLKA